MRYINYARRSSDEKSKKQVQSIVDQLADTRRLAENARLNVIEEMTESKSAKEPGRPVFNAMIEKIRKGEADAILCWKLDRLARNPIDAATLRWMMRQGHLKEIRTPYQTYLPEDNAVITAVESAMAEQYIIDLKKGVERGMRSKCEKGGFPFRAPQGYTNNRLNQTIEKDPKRFDLLQRAWLLLISKQHTVSEIHRLLVDEWGYRSRQNGVTVSGKLTCSGLYKIFRNPFYKGEFQFQGKIYHHSCEPMVTQEEWNKAQEVINRRARKGKNHHKHAYTGLITCASCGFSVTAEISKGHTYYHCANRLGICTKKGIREEIISLQIDDLLKSITMPAEFEAFALKVIDELKKKEADVQHQTVQLQTDTLRDINRQKDALLSLHLAGHLSQDEYIAKKKTLDQEASALKPTATATDETELKALKNVVRFTTHAATLFQKSDQDMKRRIAGSLADSFVLNNGHYLQVELHPIFTPVRTSWKMLPQEFQSFEPSEIISDKSKKPLSELQFQQWCATFVEYRQYLERNKALISPSMYKLE